MVFLVAYTWHQELLTVPMLPTGLQRHRATGVYYLRRRIPRDLLTCYPGKAEVTFSLKTKDYRAAVERHRLEEAKLTTQWAERRQRLAEGEARRQVQTITRIDSLTPEVIETICQHAEAAALASDEGRRESVDPYTAEELEYSKAGYAEANGMLKKAVGEGNQDILRPLVEEHLYLCGYRINASEAEMRRLALAYGRMAIRANEKLLNRFEGYDEPTPKVARSLTTPMLSEVATEYLKHYEKRDKAAMLLKVRTTMPLLLDIVGDKPIGSLTQDDLNHFFDAIQGLPPRWKDVCRRQNVSVRELSELAVGEMSKGSFDGTYLAVMTPFIRYCRLKWQARGWPLSLTTEGIEYMGSRKEPENGQRPFKPDELTRLFSGPEMAAFAVDADKAHKYWLPTVGLFTGARVNELCQLNPQCDIRQDVESGHWFLDITDESRAHKAVKKSVKTPGSKRKVPIHPLLIELGFLQYVERMKENGHMLLFPGFPPSVGKASPKAGEWFIDLMRDLGLRDETPKARLVGMHAFRSTLMNRAMVLRVVGIEVITGHANKVTKLERVVDGQVEGARSDVVIGYQGDFPLDQKMEILERINYGSLAFHRPVAA